MITGRAWISVVPKVTAAKIEEHNVLRRFASERSTRIWLGMNVLGLQPFVKITVSLREAL